MNIKALEKAFRKEAMRLVKAVTKDNVYKSMNVQIQESLNRLEKEYEAENDDTRPTIKETGPQIKDSAKEE
jgi:hypothetical protein